MKRLVFWLLFFCVFLPAALDPERAGREVGRTVAAFRRELAAGSCR